MPTYKVTLTDSVLPGSAVIPLRLSTGVLHVFRRGEDAELVHDVECSRAEAAELANERGFGLDPDPNPGAAPKKAKRSKKKARAKRTTGDRK